MAGSSGQAMGLAVGAAIGSFVPGIGAFAGGAIGTAFGGYAGSTKMNKIQAGLEREAIETNRALSKLKAASTSASHASSFRQALAHHVSLASMRGGSGSIASQFASQAYRTFEEDQKAIEIGADVADLNATMANAGVSARLAANNTASFSRLISAFDGVNLNAARSK